MRLSAAGAHAALLLGAFGVLFGCAAPAPPEPPSPPKPSAAPAARTRKASPAGPKPMASRASGISRPAAPEGLAAIPARSRTGAPEVDLSWAISDAANLAGYNVYRSQEPDKRGARLNAHVLLVPEFRDTTVSAGVTYRYRVTAVDTAGNQSAPGTPVTVSIPAAGRGSP